MASKYIKELGRIMNDKSPAAPTTRTRAEIEADIAAISKALVGPMSNTERLLLVGDRADLRKQLAALPASP